MNVPLTHTPSLASSPSASGPRRSDLKLAAFLGLAGLVAFGFVVPYSNTLLPATRLEGLVVPIAAVAQGVITFLFAWGGLRMGRTLGLDAPLLRGAAAAGTEPTDATGTKYARSFAVSAAGGALAVGAGLLLSYFVDLPHVTLPHVPRWMGLLASFAAPLLEEVMCRLFAMTAVVWVTSKVFRSRGTGVFVFGNAVAALAFAAMHLPQAISIFGGLSFGLVLVIVASNGALGILCGYLFKAKGLEHAMAAHLGADLLLHVLLQP